jgi:hypothetical protein
MVEIFSDNFQGKAFRTRKWNLISSKSRYIGRKGLTCAIGCILFYGKVSRSSVLCPPLNVTHPLGEQSCLLWWCGPLLLSRGLQRSLPEPLSWVFEPGSLASSRSSLAFDFSFDDQAQELVSRSIRMLVMYPKYSSFRMLSVANS